MNRLFRTMNVSRWLTLSSILILSVAIISLVLASSELYAAIKTQEAKVTAREQADSPLIIIITGVAPSDPKAPEFSYEVLNISHKAISAYAIRHDALVGNSQSSGVMLVSMRSVNSLLHSQARLEETFRGITYAAGVNEVALSVDFVEFEDGTRWGTDAFKMSEKLAGRRAGGRAALKKLRDLAKTRGLKAVLDALEENIDGVAQSAESQLWKEGFDEGVRIVQAKLKHAQHKNGVAALEKELLESFDTSEGRQ